MKLENAQPIRQTIARGMEEFSCVFLLLNFCSHLSIALVKLELETHNYCRSSSGIYVVSAFDDCVVMFVLTRTMDVLAA